jgi:PAS domain S-box-containing protein
MTQKPHTDRTTPAPYTDAILESISDGVFTVDDQWRVSSFNRAAEQITGIARSEALGRPCSEVFRSSLCEGACALGKTLSTGKPIVNKSCYIINAQGDRIPISVSTAVLQDAQGQIIGGAETFRDLSDVVALRKALRSQCQIGDMVSHSPAMRQICELVSAVASSDSTVLIQGETGTGKELLARAIHGSGTRVNKPFVALNCAALPDTLLESELFGYKKGAFTGADQNKPGRFALAKDGTLFLDEIGEISPALQVRLLRVLQERTYDPLGSTQPETSKARIIAATNRDLSNLVKQGSFREDLFYRIHVVRLDLPPLRQRKEDIPLLVDHFLDRFNRLQQRDITGVTSDVLTLFMAHDWPGNIRELENAMEHAFVLCRGKHIRPDHLPIELTGHVVLDEKNSGIKAVQRVTEEQAIRAALKRNQNNRLATARELGVHKTTLYRKMKAFGMIKTSHQ